MSSEGFLLFLILKKRNGRDQAYTYSCLTFSYLKSKITLVTRIGTLTLLYYSCDFWKERLLSKST
jgi:hypothetical protein